MSSDVTTLARRAREASRALGLATRATKDAALHAMADALEAGADDVLAANADDVRRAEAADVPAPMVDRLRLTPDRLAAMAVTRSGVSRSRSTMGGSVPAASARRTSLAFAASTSSARATNASAIPSNAASFAARVASARSRDAARALPASSVTSLLMQRS